MVILIMEEKILNVNSELKIVLNHFIVQKLNIALLRLKVLFSLPNHIKMPLM